MFYTPSLSWQIYVRYFTEDEIEFGQVFVGHFTNSENLHLIPCVTFALNGRFVEGFVRETFCDFVNPIFNVTFYIQYELLINIRSVCFLIVFILLCDVNNRRELARIYRERFI